MGEDLRGSALVFSTKDVMVELSGDMKHVRTQVDILVSQNLSERLDRVEGWRDKVSGQIIAVAAVISLTVTLVGLLLTALVIVAF